MNILLIAPQPFFQNRGTPIAVKMLAQVLAEYGHTIHLLTYHEGDNVFIKNVIIHRIPALPWIRDIRPGFSFKKVICDIFVFFAAIRLINTYTIDIIHAIEESVFFAMIFRYLYGKEYIYDMDSSMSDQLIEKYPHLSLLNTVFEFFESQAVKHSLGVIPVCKSLETKARQYSPFKNLLRLEDVSMLDKRVNFPISLKEMIKVDGKIIMYVGNLESYQGINLLLNGFSIACERNSKIHLVIIGGAKEDLIKYRSFSKELKIENRIHFLGPRPIEHLHYYLSNADVLVSPRLKGNNTPMKIYSYLDSGRPVIATDLETHTQVLNDTISILVPPEPTKLADAILSVIENNEFAQEIVSNANHFIQANHTIEAFAAKLNFFYKKIESDLEHLGKRAEI